ncbi:hypothetical protein [Lysobacter arvi]|uniref:DUF2846 domain-containing protein n=1 Tax=Lysobacter arvi TaxID=3038776 RepID=A0ABU1CHP2_9GAMM|nr:hypothetical protein [Lysobacter arvi]MDR0184454.1 hypothetical protein [Lysobacter arvi]
MHAFGLPLLSLALFAGTCVAGGQASPSAAPTRAADDARCGRISVFDVAPRSEELYRARVMNIDGRLPGPTGARSFRVTPGRHVLEVAELIDPEQFNDVQRRQRDMRPNPYKELVVDVQPDTTYLLAARLVTARRNFINDGSYWEPVIYRQNSEPCQ